MLTFVLVTGASESKVTFPAFKEFQEWECGTRRRVALVGASNARHTPYHV